MYRSLLRCCLAVSCISCTVCLTAAEWHYPLYRAGAGWWQGRLRIAVANQTPRAAEGQPAVVRIGNAAGEADLAGQRAEAVRLCNEQGVEMLFAVYGPHEDLVASGPIPAGSTLVFPVECKPQQSAVYYVYFDNPDAGEVPDFFTARPALVNGDMEQGDFEADSGKAPVGWTHDPPDAHHRASWTTENPQSGKRCLKTVVDEGAPPTWIATRQGDIAILGGARYRISAWVKAENVKGIAAWYIQVGTAEKPVLVAPRLAGGGGTYGWKEVSAEFTAPAEANLASLGTILHGTGTAWFDNVRLECLEPVRLKALAEKPERRMLADAGAHAPWRDVSLANGAPDAAAAYDHRVAVRLFNGSQEAIGKKLFTVDAAMVTARSRGGLDECLAMDDSGRAIRANYVGDRLLFEADVPGRSVRTCHVYWRGDRGCPLHQAGGMAGKPRPGDVTLSAWNLVKNPDFSLGGIPPAHWTHELGSPPRGIEFTVEDPRHPSVGKWCSKMHVPSNMHSEWRGWHQSVPIQSGRTYLVSAWVKYQDVSEKIAIHSYQNTAHGGVASSGNIGLELTGATKDWTLLSGTFTASPEAASLELHLTMLGTGTLWWGGVTVVETARAMLGRVEGRPARSPDQLDVWQMPAIVKAFQDDLPPRTIAPVRISAARNEREPLQLAIRSGRNASQVRVEVDAPRGPKNARLGDWEINVVGYVPIDAASAYFSQVTAAWRRAIPNDVVASDGWPGRWPDPLLPKDTFDLAANTTQPVWITVAVPKNVPAGDYTGAVRLVAGGKRLWQQPLTVHVWDFSLPDESHVAAKFDVSPGLGEKWWGKPWDKVRPEIVAMMARQRLCPDRVQPDPVFKYENGQATADFTAFDRAAEHYFRDLKLPYAWTPECFYAFGWGLPPPAFLGQQPYAGEPPFEKADRNQLRPEYKKVYQACLKLFWEHLKQKGWDRKFVLYISDEPYDWLPRIVLQMKALCRMIHEVDRKIPIYSSTWKHVPAWDGSLDIWGFGHYGLVPPETIAKVRAAGARVWWTTDGQMCTDTPYCAVERLLPHYCFKYGAEAYEFWGICWTTYDPHRFGWHAYIPVTDQPGQLFWTRNPNGDGFLIYPGHAAGYDGPLSTIRLEQAREGIEDYEYLHLLRQLMVKAKAAGKNTTAAEQALARADRLVTIPNAGGCYSSKILPDPDELYLLREQVGAAIEGLGSRWDVDSFAAAVHPMKHGTAGRMPMMAWSLPLPRDNTLVKWRNSGELRRVIDLLAQRGIVPTIDHGWEWTREGAMAMAATLQEAGRPVNVLIPTPDLVESTAYADCPVWTEGPDATRQDKIRKWPCLVHYKPEKTAKLLKEQLQPYQDAGIKLAGIWLDDESLPHPWNGCYEAQISTAESRKQYPAGVLDNFGSFRKWADPLKAEIMMKACGPIRKMFPEAKLGNYDDVWSGAKPSFGLDAVMPSLYPGTASLRGPFKDKKITQQAADDFFFRMLLKIFSDVSKNKTPGKLAIPYVCRYLPNCDEKPYLWALSHHCHRELLRHLFLRGADTLYLYNEGRDQPRQSFESVEDARAVYDELLGHRPFLDEGRPVNFAEPTADGVVWSARRCGDRCLVRTFSLGKTTKVKIEPFDGISVRLEASPAGATYLVSSSGKTEKLDAGAEK